MDRESFLNNIPVLMTSIGKERVETYLKFWREALDATSNSQANRQVVYPILEANLDKLDDDLVQVLKVWLPFSFSYLPLDKYLVYAGVINCFSDLIREFPSGSKAFNLEIAIANREILLTIFTPSTFPDQWALIHSLLGSDYQVRIIGDPADNLNRAIDHCQNALQVYTHETNPEQWAAIQICIADAYGNCLDDPTNNRDLEIRCLQNALQFYKRENFPEIWARIQNSLGTVYRTRFLEQTAANLQQAIGYYQAALQVYTPDAFPENYAFTTSNLGIAYQEDRQFQNAYDVFVRAIDTVESLRSKLTSTSSDQIKQKFAEGWIVLYHRMIEICLELAQTEPDYYAKAIEYVERNKARNLVELLANRELGQQQRQREIEAEQRRLDIAERELWMGDLFAGLITYVENLEARGELPETIAKLRRENPARQQRQKDVIKDFVSRGSTLFSDSSKRISQMRQQDTESKSRLPQKVDFISFRHIQALLPDDQTAIIEWHIDMVGRCFITFIIARQYEYPKVWQSSPEDWEALRGWDSEYIAAYSVSKNQWKSDLTSRLSRLSTIMHLNDIIALVPEVCTQIVLIPDRFLQLFPLHALPLEINEGNVENEQIKAETQKTQILNPEFKTLLDKFPGGVRYAPSCQLLQLIQHRERPEFSRFFAIQNPTKDLDYAIEAETVRQYFDAAEVLVQEKATKTALEQALNAENLNAVHYIHFSCHGAFNFRSPLQSHLILADAPLTLGEIFNYDFSQCHLVTLSACETGLTDFINVSNEYISLPSSFLYAGSSSVVSSLWAVNDLSTACLIIKFYENLRDCQTYPTVAVALNKAQLWLRDVTKKELHRWISKLPDPVGRRKLLNWIREIKAESKPFESPHYWAAFCAIGQ